MMPISPSNIFIDRSRVALDNRCKRARFWCNEYKGRGIVPDGSDYALSFGSATHEVLAHVNRGERVHDALHLVFPSFRERVQNVLSPQKLEEQWSLLSGLIHGYVRLILPQFLEEYEIYSVEGECELEIAPQVTLVATPDLILRRKSDGTLWYVEYKTTKLATGRWVASWSRSIQAMAGALTVEKSVGEPLAGYIILGLYKGYDKEGQTRSPFTYWFRDKHGQESPKWKTEAVDVPVWERVGGVARAVEEMDVDLLANQYPQTPPLFVNRRLVDRWLKQLLIRERQIAAARGDEAFSDEALMDLVFPQNFDACEPAIGMSCPYRSLCFSPRGEEEPFSQGFKWREPHHVGDPALEGA